MGETKGDFHHILRILNTNIQGTTNAYIALTAIKGCGRRYSQICLKKAEIDVRRRAGTLKADEIQRVVEIMQNPAAYRIPIWCMNRKKDPKDGKDTHLVSNALDMKKREDLEKMRKIKLHRGIRHMYGLRVRGQHTKTTGRRGKTVGVSKKK